MPKERDKTVQYVLDKYDQYKSQSSARLSQYDLNEKWFLGDKDVQYGEKRENWQPTVIANIIESNIRTLVAVLTDSNPIMRVHSFPLVGIDTLGPELDKALKIFQENNDLVLSHIWRVNDMRRRLRKIVLVGCIKGLLCARTYWDKYAYGGIGEVKIQSVDPKYIFFDKNTEDLNIADGSCECFIFRVSKPLSWFNYYWPGKKINPSVDTEKEPEIYQKADYIEAYLADYDWERTTKVADGKYSTEEKRKYPFGRRVVIGGDTKLEDGGVDYFPFSVEPIADHGMTLMGQDDVQRQVEMQKDLNYKMDQLSTIIALNAFRQAVGDEECGVDIEEMMQKFVDKPGQFFKLQGGKTMDDFHKHFEFLQSPQAPPELFNYVYTLLEFMEKVTGVTKLMQGLAGKRERQSAFEIGKMMETATIRLRERAAHVEDFIRSIGLNCMYLVSQNYTEPRPVWSVEQNTNQMSMATYNFPKSKNKITGKDEPIQWEYDVVVQPDSMLPTDVNSMANTAMQLKQLGVITNEEVLKRLQLNNWQSMPDQMPGGGGAAPAPPTGGGM